MGEVQLNIPIYTYKDVDFEIPIFLGYNSSGFLPNKRPSIVGLNWFLNCGGVITRSVNNQPDEREGNSLEWTGTNLTGQYYGFKNSPKVPLAKKNELFSLLDFDINAHLDWHIDNCEIAPDLFSFNMPGHSGQFYINYDGTINIIGEGNKYKVDLTIFQLRGWSIQALILQKY